MPEEKQTVAGAYARIESHEELCAERYKNLHARIDELREGQKSGTRAVWAIVLALLGFLAAQAYDNITHHQDAPAAVTVTTPR